MSDMFGTKVVPVLDQGLTDTISRPPRSILVNYDGHGVNGVYGFKINEQYYGSYAGTKTANIKLDRNEVIKRVTYKTGESR